MPSLTDPCQFCKTKTTKAIDSGPICDNCLKPYMRGRALGLSAAIEHVKKNGGSADLLKALKKL
jgi:hypothetical protein